MAVAIVVQNLHRAHDFVQTQASQHSELFLQVQPFIVKHQLASHSN